jgi:hypothetical protein
MGMAGSRCGVSCTDAEGVLHAVDMDAESLHEAVAIGVASLREDDVSSSNPGTMTQFTVAVHRNPVEHKVRLQPGIEMVGALNTGRASRDHEMAETSPIARFRCLNMPSSIKRLTDEI